MSESDPPPLGSIVWQDLTVPDASKLRDFYAQVVGWTSTPVGMGSYSDYCMNTRQDGKTVAGICHAKGINANVPAQWLIYISVGDVDRAVAKCKELGGAVIDGPRALMGQRFCVIRDPAGAVAALFGP
jgi:predicted enzyme related to lactoylglutathione lyase